MIVNEFKTEKELYDVYPKKFHWYLKDIFNDYWYEFLNFAEKKKLTIRPVVLDFVILVALSILNNVLFPLNLNFLIAPTDI